jgi:Tfp pilus assembly protein PilW
MEVMVSIGMLSVAALSILSVFVGGLKLMQRSNEMAAANDVAKSTLEAIKRDFQKDGFAALPTADYTFDGRVPDAVDSTGPNTFPPAPYPALKIGQTNYEVVVQGNPEGTRLRRVRVLVYWNDNQPVELETLLHP